MSAQNLTLLTDLYELTMMQGYFETQENETVIFDMFFRENPNKGGYSIMAGLEQVIEYIKNLNFSYEDVDYLRGLGIFSEDFLHYLSGFHFSGDIYAIPEGSVIFPREPLIKVVAPIMEAIEAGLVPVVTPLGTGIDGQIYNINADIAACRIAEAIHARKLVFLSDVPGILADCTDENSVIPTIRTDEMDELIQRKIISGGMLPKLRSCVNALNAGINKVHLIDGRVMHTLLLEIFTDHGVGTQIVRPDSVM